MEVGRPFEAVLPMAEGQLDEHEVAAVAVVVDVQLPPVRPIAVHSKKNVAGPCIPNFGLKSESLVNVYD